MMISVQEAHRLITQSLARLGSEELPLGQLQGRVLAREMTAPAISAVSSSA
jgi:molybdopterin biosynthesis enzyme